MWTKESMRKILQEKIGDNLLIVVSNREPYVHRWKDGQIVCEKPASGLVTAMDPILKATEGVWIAASSGNADKKVCDDKGRVRVPPGKERYTLRRVSLTKEEEMGFYYGFSNSMFWPMCHITFARPSFNQTEWESYKSVNEKFADAVLDEIGNKKAFVWVQDFHFALLPAIIKNKKPDTIVAQFWHVPWPNPEIFRICPWGKEILEGMLGNDLIGFHIKMHSDNFLNSVDQTLEVRVDRERSTIFHHGGVETKVQPFPISVDATIISEDAEKDYTSNDVVRDVISLVPKDCPHIAVGVDRVDYTKGIPERIKAVDKLLGKHPELIGKFIYLQIGSLSRIHIRLYKELNDEINRLIEEINWKYATDEWSPVIFLRRNITYPEVLYFYKLANICLVSSLHDGMNLVAKEYVASKNNEDGVLVLSKFTGAAREFDKHALVINPYDIEGFADTIYSAITMPEEERKERMKKMRQLVFDNNIYQWGSNFISELVRLA